jgi:hypothetical protein
MLYISILAATLLMNHHKVTSKSVAANFLLARPFSLEFMEFQAYSRGMSGN